MIWSINKAWRLESYSTNVDFLGNKYYLKYGYGIRCRYNKFSRFSIQIWHLLFVHLRLKMINFLDSIHFTTFKCCFIDPKPVAAPQCGIKSTHIRYFPNTRSYKDVCGQAGI